MQNIAIGLNWVGHFTALDVPEAYLPHLKQWLADGNPLAKYQFIEPADTSYNILMTPYLMAGIEATYAKIDRLVITNQTDPPSSSEVGYTGDIYTTIAGDELYRSGIQRPYRVAWTIGSTSANGVWGSYCLIDKDGNLINRAIANTTKQSGKTRVIEFEGTVN
jgi:hypothetical protein